MATDAERWGTAAVEQERIIDTMRENSVRKALEAHVLQLQAQGLIGQDQALELITGKTAQQRLEDEVLSPVEEWVAEGEHRAELEES